MTSFSPDVCDMPHEILINHSPFDCLDEPAAANMIERVQDMYMAILESEECIERVVCELGGLVEDAGYSKQMTK